MSAARTLSELELRAPSRLPGWRRAHVIAHVVLNAEGFSSAARELATHGLGLMYPSGVNARDAAIDELSRLSLSQLLDQLAAAHHEFLVLWDPLPAPGPCATSLETPRFDSSTVPGRRLRELQVHLLDLGVDLVTPDDWLDEFVDDDLPIQWATVQQRTELPVHVVDERGDLWSANTAGATQPLQQVGRRQLLAWTLDRVQIDGLPQLGEWGNRSRWENPR